MDDRVSHFYNPYHDKRGRFASAPGGSGGSEVDRILAAIRAKNTRLAHLQVIHDQFKNSGVLSGDQTMAVDFYEGSFQRCGAMNDLLRFGTIRGKNLNTMTRNPERVQKHVDNLKGAFTYAPRLPEPTVLYRTVRNMPKAQESTVTKAQIDGILDRRMAAKKSGDATSLAKIDVELNAAMKAYQAGGTKTLAGMVLKDEGFMSTTPDERIAKGYMTYSTAGESPALLKLTAPAGTPVIAVDAVKGKDRTATEGELLLQPGTSYKVTSDVMDGDTRIITGEIIPAESNLSELLPIVSMFFNPYHDQRGRFATSPGNAITKPDGGFTFDPVKGRMASTGFAVSPFPERSKVIDVETLKPKEIRAAVTDYITQNMDLAEKENHYVGGWRDPADGKVYLDISIVVKDKAEAVRIAKEKDQIAIFDFQTFQSITVDPNAKSGQLSEGVSHFYNKNHDARGRFASGGVFGRVREFFKGQKRMTIDEIDEHFQDSKNVSATERRAIALYEGSFAQCGAINDLLRHGTIRDEYMLDTEMVENGYTYKEVERNKDAMLGIFAKAPLLAEETTVYRGVRNFHGSPTSMTGEVLKDEGFMSTTTDPDIAEAYVTVGMKQKQDPAMLKITAPAGTPVVAVHSILRNAPVGTELLLQPGTTIKVTGDTVERGTRVITGEIVEA